MDRYLIVVARNQLTLCDYFRPTFLGDPEVRVLLDRRWRERRQHAKEYETQRRRGDRRQAPGDGDLRAHGFVIVRPSQDGMGLTELETLLTELCQQVEIIAPRAIPADTAEGPSVPTSSRHRVAPVKGRGGPIHPSAPDEKLQPDLFDHLTEDFSADPQVQVVLDQRRRERRRRVQGAERECRRSDRRRQPDGWTVKLSEFYRGQRPSFLPLAADLRPTIHLRREDGSSFFGRAQRSHTLGN